MREIKFRGRRSHDKEWVVGNLVIDNLGNKHIVPFSFFEKDGHHLQYNDDTDKPVFFDQETIEQFTGLHDKNGKEIYEGDILENPDYEEAFVVEYHEGMAGYIGWGDDKIAGCYLITGDEIEIIGNIHENPELLEGRE